MEEIDEVVLDTTCEEDEQYEPVWRDGQACLRFV